MSYIVKATTGTKFKLQKTIWKDGKSHREAVPKTAWQELGFSPSMSLEKAKVRAKLLNKQSSIEKQTTQKVIRAAARLELEKAIDTVYTPTDINAEFVEWLKVNYIQRHKSKTKLLSHWVKAQDVLRCLKLMPKDFYLNKNAIVGYFQERRLSLDYTKKILRLIDMWGYFYSEKHGMFYRPIPTLTTTILNP